MGKCWVVDMGERKVYSRRSFKELDNSKINSNLLREQQAQSYGF